MPDPEDPKPIMTVLLDDILLQLKRMTELLGGAPAPIPGATGHKDYVSRSTSVNSSAAYVMDVVNDLGRSAKYGYICSDTGMIQLKLNEGENIELQMGDVHVIRVEENYVVERIRITTASATNLGFRLFLS